MNLRLESFMVTFVALVFVEDAFNVVCDDEVCFAPSEASLRLSCVELSPLAAFLHGSEWSRVPAVAGVSCR